MVDIATFIPLTVGGILGLLINVIIITIILAVADKFIAHEMSIKNSFIMALIAYLVVPLLLGFANIAFAFASIIIPLIVWIILGEILLKGSRKGKMMAAGIAFVVYLLLTFAGVPGMMAGLIPF